MPQNNAVVRVIDYESPLPRKPSRSRLSRTRTPLLSPADTAHIRAAGAFADATLRRILEVIDRRRPLAQLRPLLAAGLVDSLLRATALQGGTGVARLRRVRVQSIPRRGGKTPAAEIAASYTRGDRVHAVACRAELVKTMTGARWQLVALHLG